MQLFFTLIRTFNRCYNYGTQRFCTVGTQVLLKALQERKKKSQLHIKCGRRSSFCILCRTEILLINQRLVWQQNLHSRYVFRYNGSSLCYRTRKTPLRWKRKTNINWMLSHSLNQVGNGNFLEYMNHWQHITSRCRDTTHWILPSSPSRQASNLALTGSLSCLVSGFG